MSRKFQIFLARYLLQSGRGIFLASVLENLMSTQEDATDAMKRLNLFLSEEKSFKSSDGLFLMEKTRPLANV